MEIGDKLSGRYLLTDFIGQGGMANVFLAQDLILERQVAVKVLRFDFQDNQDAIRRFQREAMSASQLLHRNIVEIYDVEEKEDQQDLYSSKCAPILRASGTDYESDPLGY